jgi:hypothetical protein
MKYKITYSTTESITLETPEICSISDLNGVAQVMAEQLRKDVRIVSWEKIEKMETPVAQVARRAQVAPLVTHGNESQSGMSHSSIMPEGHETPETPVAPRIGEIS